MGAITDFTGRRSMTTAEHTSLSVANRANNNSKSVENIKFKDESFWQPGIHINADVTITFDGPRRITSFRFQNRHRYYGCFVLYIVYEIVYICDSWQHRSYTK